VIGTGARLRAIGAGLLLPAALVASPGTVSAAPDSSPPPAPKTTRTAPAKTTRSAPANPAKPSKSPPARTTRPAPKATARTPDACVHTVRSGETVARVASRHGVSRQDLVAVNQVGRSGTLRVGQRLKVPGCVKGTSSRDRIASLEIARPEADLLLARVGPARVPTWLFLGVPQVGAHTVDFAWPVTGTVASPFGRRRSGWHAGVDIKAATGTPIVAAAAGRVIFSGWARSYGRLIKIEHGNGFVTVYAHNQENLVAVGDQVEAGVVIATVGSSGRSSAAHLHFEIRHGDMVYDPTLFLPDTTMLARSEEPTEAVADEDEDE
jgi:murein DD-endopeptidase MepM/ murein hydrolase activator NlpD